MAYREVTMLEVKEVLRQWLAGSPKKRIAARLGCDPKTVRRYIAIATTLGLDPGGDADILTDAFAARVSASVQGVRQQERGDSWKRCQEQRAFIAKKLSERVRLSKVRRLLVRQGVDIPYATLHRYAVLELDYGKRATTVPVADGEPGKELQVDTGWVLSLEPNALGRRRRMRAWIFTPVVSRYRFVYPCEQETTESAIEACEAAWEFYGGVFGVLVPDNTKAIVETPDALGAKINETFLEYSQSRGFVIDPARVRSPKDKARVERSVRDVRDDCFGGERIATLAQARERALTWSSAEYGLRRHTTTRRMPKEHFESDECSRLLSAPTEPYDIPSWSDPKVAPDQFAAVAKALYSLPRELRGRRLRARADSQTVRFYDKRGNLLKAHPRVAAGQKSIDPSDFPSEKSAYAQRDVAFLEAQAREHGEPIGDLAREILAGPLPWTRMRQVRALLRLVKKYGAERVAEACRTALAVEMTDVRRLRRMLELAATPPPVAAPRAKVIPIAKYLREPAQYALPLARRDGNKPQGEKHE